MQRKQQLPVVQGRKAPVEYVVRHPSNGVFPVYATGVPGLATAPPTREETVVMLQDAIIRYLERMDANQPD